MNLVRHKFSYLGIAYWCSNCSFFVFIAHFFYERHMANASIGMLMTLYTISGFCGQLVLAFIADKFQSQKKVALVASFMTILTILSIYFSNIPFIILMPIFGFFNMPIPMLIDAWILYHYHDHPEVYSRIRSVASLAFAFYSLLIASLITTFGTIVMPIGAIFFSVSNIFVMAVLKEEKIARHKEPMNLSELKQNKDLFFILASLIFIGIPIGINMQLQLPIITALGGNTSVFGKILFLNAFIQYPVFRYYYKLHQIRTQAKLFLGICLYVVSFSIVLIKSTIPFYFISICLNGVAFAILFASLREFSARNIKKNLQTVSLSLMDSCQNCIGASIGSFIGGIILDVWNVKILFLINVCFGLFSILFLWIAQRRILKF